MPLTRPRYSRIDAPSFHGGLQRLQRGVAFCDDEQTRGVAIEAMHEAGAQHVARKRFLDVRQKRVDERAAGCAVRRMRHHSGRLVDHEQIVVFVQNRQLDRFGVRDECTRRRNFELEHVAFFQQKARLRGCAVDQNFPKLRPLRDPRTGRAGE